MTKIPNYEPLLKADVVYKILDLDEIEDITRRRTRLSINDYKRLVIERVVANLQPTVIGKIAALKPQQALKASQALYRSCIALNPLLETSTQFEHGQIEPLDPTRVAGLEAALKSRIVGQDDAIKRVVSRVKQATAGLSTPGRPRGVMMFVGPSGVGKTELAKALQDNLFTGTRLVRVDCSEFSESHTKSRLIGAPPSYVGYDQGGQLTEEVKLHPNTVLLLDEVEKAHPTLFDLFLQVFDEGYITDSKGDRIDFSGTFIIMTSNVGTQRINERHMGFNSNHTSYEDMCSDVMVEIKKRFRVEFLGRIDDITVFHPLTSPDLAQIAEMQLVELGKRAKSKGTIFKWSSAVPQWLVDTAEASRYGARQIAHTIAEKIRDPLAEFVLTQPKDCVISAMISKRGDLRLTPKKTRRQAGNKGATR